MIESIIKLVLIMLLVFAGLYELFDFFLKDRRTRKYWIKWWIGTSAVVGTCFWLILNITGN